MSNAPLRLRPAGDRALLAEYGDDISPAVNALVRRAFAGLTQAAPDWLVEAAPAYRSLMITYHPELAGPAQVEEFLVGLARQTGAAGQGRRKVTEIPVCYGGELGPDLAFVAESHGIGQEEAIALHSAPEYLIYMLGFAPGFPFLGGLDPRLATPRLTSPRTFVPAGSVGIANSQTGIYSADSAGGWQIVGRTPLKLFDLAAEQPFLLTAGDYLRFKPISLAEHQALAAQGGR